MKIISASIFFVFILIFGFGLNACDRSDRVEAARETDSRDDRQDMLTEEDKDFVLYASEMHIGEADLAKLAKQKSMNKDITDYADAVIGSHADALKQLSERMRQKGASLSTMGSLDTKYHTEFLSPLSGAEFDRQFIELMIADHQDAGSTFRTQLNATANKDLKDCVQHSLPELENRLREARDLQSKLKAQGSRTN